MKKILSLKLRKMDPYIINDDHQVVCIPLIDKLNLYEKKTLDC